MNCCRLLNVIYNDPSFLSSLHFMFVDVCCRHNINRRRLCCCRCWNGCQMEWNRNRDQQHSQHVVVVVVFVTSLSTISHMSSSSSPPNAHLSSTPSFIALTIFYYPVTRMHSVI